MKLPSQDEFISGAVAGIGQTITSHPIDTIKTRMQILHYNSPLSCLTQTINEHGFQSLYKGMGAPIVGVSLVNAVLFTAYGQGKQIFNQDYYKAGMFAGFINSFVCSPIEMIKIRLQSQLKFGEYSGPVNVIKTTIMKNGISGIYRGLPITIVKEIPACGGWYGGFELCKQLLRDQDGHLSLGKLMFSGSIGGISYWTCCFPIDVIKVRIQQNPMASTSALFHVKQVFKQYGWRGFYRGYSVSIIRAIPSSGNYV